jgi:hypothetical protein
MGVLFGPAALSRTLAHSVPSLSMRLAVQAQA